jgi:hypothetical protein
MIGVLLVGLSVPVSAQCQIPLGDFQVQYRGHGPETLAPRLRVFLPQPPVLTVEGPVADRIVVVAMDPYQGETETWYDSGSYSDGDERPASIDREASLGTFRSGHVQVELYVAEAAGDPLKRCASVGPIPLPPFGAGVEHYGPVLSGANTVFLHVEFAPLASPIVEMRVSGAPKSASGWLIASMAPANDALFGGIVLIDLSSVLIPLPLVTDDNGQAILIAQRELDIDPILFLQAAILNASAAGGVSLSNGVSIPW